MDDPYPQQLDLNCKAPTNYTIQPRTPEELQRFCADARNVHHGTFTGKLLFEPIKIFDLTMLEFDLDMYDIHLHELHKTVDYFVVLESKYTSFGHIKPFLMHKNKDRFKKFWSKIILFEAGDAGALGIEDWIRSCHNDASYGGPRLVCFCLFFEFCFFF